MQKRYIDAGGEWTVEERIDAEGKPGRSYYFRQQLAVRVEHKSKASRRLAGLTLIEKDIRTIKGWLRLLRDTLNSMGPAADQSTSIFMPRDERMAVVRAIHVAIVTTYAKMFTQAEGRGASLERNGWIFGDTNLERHDWLMHHRHTFTAHSGSDGPEGCSIVVAIDHSQRNRTEPRIFTELHQPASLLHTSLDEVENLLNELHDKLQEKIQKAQDFVEREARGSLTETRLRIIRKGATGRYLRRK